MQGLLLDRPRTSAVSSRSPWRIETIIRRLGDLDAAGRAGEGREPPSSTSTSTRSRTTKPTTTSQTLHITKLPCHRPSPALDFQPSGLRPEGLQPPTASPLTHYHFSDSAAPRAPFSDRGADAVDRKARRRPRALLPAEGRPGRRGLLLRRGRGGGPLDGRRGRGVGPGGPGRGRPAHRDADRQ